MTPRAVLLSCLVLAGASVQGAAAAAPGCARLRADLAALERSAGASGLAAAGAAQRREVVRLTAYYRSIGCDGGGFSFFGAPPECGALAQRIRTMDASSAQLAAAGVDTRVARRRQLRAAIARECEADERRDTAEKADGEKTPRATGGGRLVCVRTCDGYFFPLQNVPAGGGRAAQMCRALCPNAETAVFHAPVHGDIENAISDRGKPYTKLANASRYLKTVDKACSCKKEGQSWAEALARAERLIASRPGDIVVTAKLAQELSRPKLALSHVRSKKSRARPPDPAAVAARAGDIDVTGTVKPDSAPAADAGSGSDIGTAARPRLIRTTLD